MLGARTALGLCQVPHRTESTGWHCHQCPHSAKGPKPLQITHRGISHGLTLLCLWGHQGCSSCAPWGRRDIVAMPAVPCATVPHGDIKAMLHLHRPQAPLWSLESHGTAPAPVPRHHPGVPKSGVTWLSPSPHLSLPACQPLVALPLADVVGVPCLEGVPLHGALPQARLPAQPTPQPPTGALWEESGVRKEIRAAAPSPPQPPPPVSTLTHTHANIPCGTHSHMCTHSSAHTQTHKGLHTLVLTLTCPQMHTLTAVCTHMQVYTHTCRCTHTHARSHLRALMRTQLCTSPAHPRKHTWKHTHSYVHTHLPPFSGCRSCFPPSPPCLHTEQSSHQCRAMGWDAGRAGGQLWL